MLPLFLPTFMRSILLVLDCFFCRSLFIRLQIIITNRKFFSGHRIRILKTCTLDLVFIVTSFGYLTHAQLKYIEVREKTHTISSESESNYPFGRCFCFWFRFFILFMQSFPQNLWMILFESLSDVDKRQCNLITIKEKLLYKCQPDRSLNKYLWKKGEHEPNNVTYRQYINMYSSSIVVYYLCTNWFGLCTNRFDLFIFIPSRWTCSVRRIQFFFVCSVFFFSLNQLFNWCGLCDCVILLSLDISDKIENNCRYMCHWPWISFFLWLFGNLM